MVLGRSTMVLGRSELDWEVSGSLENLIRRE